MDNLGILTSKSVRRVSLVVTAVDDFTGRVITGSNVRVWIEGEKPPIKKAEGWNVFLNLAPGEYTVIAEGGFYNRASLVCRVDGDSLPNLKLRLTPSKQTPLPSGAGVIEGKAAPGSKLLIRPDERAMSYKLLAELSAGDDKIAIFHPDGIDIEGKLICISSPDAPDEYRRVLKSHSKPRAEYLLDRALEHGRVKIGTLIYPVSECNTDARGEFFLPLAGLSSKESSFVCTDADTLEKKLDFKLTSGERLKLEIN